MAEATTVLADLAKGSSLQGLLGCILVAVFIAKWISDYLGEVTYIVLTFLPQYLSYSDSVNSASSLDHL